MKKSKLVLLASVLSVALFSGCSTVPLEPKEVANQAKSFNAPSEGNAGLYVYRDSFVGQALKKDVFIDDKCLGETANGVFFYQSVEGDKEHKVSTEQTIYRYLNGQRELKIELVPYIAEVLEVDEQELFRFDIEYACEYNLRYSKDAREILELLFYVPKPMIEHIKTVMKKYKQTYTDGIKEL